MEVELMVTKSDDDDQPTDIRVNIEQSASGWLEGRVLQFLFGHTHWLHLNLLPKCLWVFCKCFSLWHCSHLNRLCGKITKLSSFIVQKYKLKRNHQDETFVCKFSAFNMSTLVTFIFDSFMMTWNCLFSQWLNSYFITPF